MKQSLLAIIPLLVLATTANVYASGPRLDYPMDSSEEGKDCWVEGYDAGFSQKYDKEPIYVPKKMMNITDLWAMPALTQD